MSFKEVHKKILNALKDDDLRKGSKESTKNELINRKNAIERFENINRWSDEVKKSKKEIMANFNFYFEEFKKNVEKRGFNFHYARDEKEAREIFLNILKDAKLVVKSKSMVGEEISIRQFLEINGIKVYETDLGEFLVQISNGKPAHMVTPAVNITKKKASILLEKYIEKKTDDIGEMVLGVRKFMREIFLKADAGIIGANSISLDGEIVFITNEGNGALTHLLPKKIIIITSVEKILMNLDDCIKEAFVQTVFDGYRNISYMHILEYPGDKDIHLIILDNGRIENFNTFLSETLLCIKCGSCQLACPIFKEVDGAWGDIYTAAIGIAWTYITGNKEKAISLSYLCLSCGICHEVCPMKINIPEILIKIKKIH
ncbi:MAG: LUD domain-containing protein [Thermoplasmata archaeon]|nr:LUD domain-containing protein [Staphylococcus epidermidis]